MEHQAVPAAAVLRQQLREPGLVALLRRVLRAQTPQPQMKVVEAVGVVEPVLRVFLEQRRVTVVLVSPHL
jgi:hypothetical protein